MYRLQHLFDSVVSLRTVVEYSNGNLDKVNECYNIMHELICIPGKDREILPNVLRCPFCNKDTSKASDEYARKHVRKCAYRLNPYVYGKNPRGRPPKTKVMETLGI